MNLDPFWAHTLQSSTLITLKNLKRVMVRDGICGVTVDALKNCCSQFQLILCYFWFIISPHTKYHPNRTKNKEVRNFQYSLVLVSRAGKTKNSRRYFKLILSCFYPIISPHTKFHPNLTKKHGS